jgi:hypothetical protein
MVKTKRVRKSSNFGMKTRAAPPLINLCESDERLEPSLVTVSPKVTVICCETRIRTAQRFETRNQSRSSSQQIQISFCTKMSDRERGGEGRCHGNLTRNSVVICAGSHSDYLCYVTGWHYYETWYCKGHRFNVTNPEASREITFTFKRFR